MRTGLVCDEVHMALKLDTTMNKIDFDIRGPLAECFDGRLLHLPHADLVLHLPLCTHNAVGRIPYILRLFCEFPGSTGPRARLLLGDAGYYIIK